MLKDHKQILLQCCDGGWGQPLSDGYCPYVMVRRKEYTRPNKKSPYVSTFLSKVRKILPTIKENAAIC